MDHTMSQKISEVFPSSKGGTLSAIQVVPRSFKFSTQNEGEKVFLLTRAAAITNFGWVVASILLFILPLILSGYVVSFLGILDISVRDLFTRPLVIPTILFLYYLLAISYSFNAFLKWYFNIYIVTNERIVDYDFIPYGKYKISEASLKNIEDVTQKQVGVFPNIFNYGDIVIQTAAQRMQFHFDKVPNPSFLRDKISDLADILKKQV